MGEPFYPERDTDRQLDTLLNQGLTLQDNMRGAMLIDIDLVFGVNTIQHGLGYVPIGYNVLWQESPGNVGGGDPTNWTEQTLEIESDVPTQKVRLFVV